MVRRRVGAVSPERDRPQRFPHPVQHACVFTDLVSPEQPHARIPRAVVAIEQPPVGQQDPGRAPQRAGEMGDAGVDGDHEVKTGNQRGGLAEVDEVSRQIDSAIPLPQNRRITRARVLLQADKGRIDIEDA